MSVRLYVGNLPKEPIERQAFQDMFVEAGPTVTTKLIKDRKTGKCRGFAFVTVPTDEMADEFIEKYNGQSFMEITLKIEKALPRSKGKGQEEGEAEEETRSVSEPHPHPIIHPTKDKDKEGRKGAKKRNRSQGGGNNSGATPISSDSFQPDPRWADKLALLKERLEKVAQPS
jgi:RNA recognition motif-containing protein